jgi:hypothetical protein
MPTSSDVALTLFYRSEAKMRAEPRGEIAHSLIGLRCCARQEVEYVLLFGIDTVGDIGPHRFSSLDQPPGIVEQSLIAPHLHTEWR